MRIVSIDFETGGTDPNRNAPVQLGVALMDGPDVVASQEWLIGPTLHWKTGKIEREYTANALEISGIPWSKIKAAPLPKAVVQDLDAWVTAHGCATHPVVSYNAPFDLSFYSTLLWLASDWHPTEKGVKVQPAPPLLGPWHCALMLARAAYPQSPDHKLDSVAARFGLSRSTDKHGALEDAVLAGLVFHELTKETK